MDLDYRAAGFWFGVGQWAFNVLVALYLVISRRQTATSARVGTVEHDIAAIRTQLACIPDQENFDQLSRDISSLMYKIGEMKGRIDAINRVFDIMNQSMMKGGS